MATRSYEGVLPVMGGNFRYTNVFIGHLGTGTGSGIVPNWGNWTFQDGYVGEFYLRNWDMPNADQPITYSVVSGSLPPGLTLSSTSTHSAQITGTPTTAGTYTFSLKAVNPAAPVGVTKSFTIVVHPANVGDTAYASVC